MDKFDYHHDIISNAQLLSESTKLFDGIAATAKASSLDGIASKLEEPSIMQLFKNPALAGFGASGIAAAKILQDNFTGATGIIAAASSLPKNPLGASALVSATAGMRESASVLSPMSLSGINSLMDAIRPPMSGVSASGIIATSSALAKNDFIAQGALGSVALASVKAHTESSLSAAAQLQKDIFMPQVSATAAAMAINHASPSATGIFRIHSLEKSMAFYQEAFSATNIIAKMNLQYTSQLDSILHSAEWSSLFDTSNGLDGAEQQWLATVQGTKAEAKSNQNLSLFQRHPLSLENLYGLWYDKVFPYEKKIEYDLACAFLEAFFIALLISGSCPNGHEVFANTFGKILVNILATHFKQ